MTVKSLKKTIKPLFRNKGALFLAVLLIVVLIAIIPVVRQKELLKEFAAGTNLLQNGDFENTGSNWLSPWTFNIKSTGGGTITQDNTTAASGQCSALINVTQFTNPGDVQLGQTVSLTAGQPYTYTFYAKAASNRLIKVLLQQDVSPYTAYYAQEVAITTSWQKYSFIFTPSVTDTTANFWFNFGLATGQVWLDNVSMVNGAITPTPSGPTPTPPAGFIYRSGSNLMLNGQKFRFTGTDADWSGWNPNLNRYTSHSEAQIEFTNMQAMHSTVLRTFALMPIGTSFSVEPSLNTWNDAAFETLDYQLSIAQQYHIHFIFPLVNNWDTGWTQGKSTYTTWEGISDENQFYYNSTVIQDYKNYIAHILNHVNQYTGVPYKDDPSILAWETGNELNDAPYSWTEQMAEYIKSLDPNHLVLDGLPYNYGGSTTAQVQNEPSVDIYSDHFYPVSVSTMQSDANAVSSYGKAYFVGEYDWHAGETVSGCTTYDSCGGDPLTTFLSDIEGNPSISGDLLWEMELPTIDPNDTYYFTLHYPGDNSDMQTRVQELVQHGINISTSNPPPTAIPPTNTPTPLPTATPTPVPTNIVSNPSFENTGTNWLSLWKFTVTTGAKGSISQSTTAESGKYAAEIAVSKANSNAWYVQLSQTSLPFTARRTYTISFWAKAASSRTLEYGLQQNYSPYNWYLINVVSLTTSWQQFTSTFTPSVTDTNVRLNFDAAHGSQTVYIDNVSIK